MRSYVCVSNAIYIRCDQLASSSCRIHQTCQEGPRSKHSKMFSTKLIRQFKFRGRQLHSTLVKNESKPVSETPKNPETSKTSEPKSSGKMDEFIMGAPMHTASNFDKRILVWVKRFPSVDQVPQQISIRTLQSAYTKARIIACGYMMVFAIVGSIISVMIGKRDTAAGENIATVRTRWYKEVQEKGRREAEEAKLAEEAKMDIK